VRLPLGCCSIRSQRFRKERGQLLTQLLPDDAPHERFVVRHVPILVDRCPSASHRRPRAAVRPYADRMWHSPFQPDAASDWANFVVGLLTAVATLVAVGLSVQSSRRSRADAIQARSDTAEAQTRTAAAEERAVKAAEEQAAASALISATERELERDRRVYQRRLETEQKASRQAASIQLKHHWRDGYDGGLPDGDLEIQIVNASSLPITDLQLEWLAPATMTNRLAADPWHGAEISGSTGKSESVKDWLFTRPPDIEVGGGVHLRLIFTDSYSDRWELTHLSRTLLLLTPRIIDVKASTSGAPLS
jgi:hypothetical protein